MTVPPFHGNINFNAQHSPMGAFMSFTCGHFGTRGGIGLQLGRPANQDLFIGVKKGDRFSDEPLMCLPFYEGALTGAIPNGMDAAAQAFLVEQGAAAKPTGKAPLIAIGKDSIHRHYDWATDAWHANDFEFAIYSPFGEIPDPTKQSPADAILPALVAELVVHNRSNHVQTACFAIGFQDAGVRMLDEGIGAGRVGFALRNHMGVMAELEDGASPAPFPILRWSAHEALRDPNPVHHLGTCPGIGFEIPPGQSRSLRIAIGVYLDGIVTTRLEGKYFYTRHYANLTDVLCTALDRFIHLEDRASDLDFELMQSGLSLDQQFLIAHSTRSYYGSTQFLDVAAQPFWVVNEGEYCMMNTLDLCVDQVFWELKQNPWVVRNVLDTFVKQYSYHDQVKDPKTGELHPGGIAFCHDMGVHNNFSRPGNSSYELPNLKGCFSYMTQEQLCNWILVAASYVVSTGDVEWLRSQEPVITACLQSIIKRQTDGMLKRDSSRCGTGQEITTYDSLDESLGQARDNLYLGVKTWSALVGLRMMFLKLGNLWAANDELRSQIIGATQNISSSVTWEGAIPAVFERENPGFKSRILAAIEGLVYPLYWSRCAHSEDVSNLAAPTEAAHKHLRQHTINLLSDLQHRNLFPDGGLKLSSTSNNSWMSKIAIFQHVAREVFHLDDDPKIAELLENADAAHVKWETDGSGYWAMCDQILSGKALGSKYYPRCITTALWLDGRKATAARANPKTV